MHSELKKKVTMEVQSDEITKIQWSFIHYSYSLGVVCGGEEVLNANQQRSLLSQFG